MNIDSKNNIVMTRGDTEYILVSCPQSPFTEGDCITFTMRRTLRSKEKMMEKQVTVFTEEGKALVHILPADTEKLEFGRYVYDMQLTRADGTVKTIITPAVFHIAEEVSYDD